MKSLSVLLVLSMGVGGFSQDHSAHHEQLTSDQLGAVRFPISCSAPAQKSFEIGVALLHSFWYSEAEKKFEETARIDPKCAMARWGVSMSLWHQLWDHPDAPALARGLEEVDRAKALGLRTDRERDYVAAANKFYFKGNQRYQARADSYSQAMEAMYQRYPEDSEAGIFYALSLLASEPDNDTTDVNRKKAAAVLEKLFAEQPSHPGTAHYLIHSYDKPGMAKLGLPAARSYAKIAPAAPHALHMPSHIFERLGLWQDDIDSNLASVAATRASTAMHMGGADHQLHAMDFLEYAYLQSGRDVDAKNAIDDLSKVHGVDRERLAYTKLDFAKRYIFELHLWQEAAVFPFAPDATEDQKAFVFYVRVIGSARKGDAQAARADFEQLERIQKSLQASKDEKERSLAGALDGYRKDAEPWVEFVEGQRDQAMKNLRDLADREDQIGEQRDSPKREMLADMLMEAKLPKLALTEYETDLRIHPNRFNGLYGAALTAEESGDAVKAREYYAQLLRICDKANSQRLALVHAKEVTAGRLTAKP
jgi:hypothetical protein